MGLALAAVALAALTALAAVFARVYRPWHLRWGATPAEVDRAMPGDGELFRSSFTATRAITVHARPEELWPWLVQIGFDRAGWYSYDLLDNLGRPSAERIVPELQSIEVGDWIPMSRQVSERTALRVSAFVPNRSLLWAKPDSTWAWILEPIDAEHTRLVSRLRCRHDVTSLPGLADLLLIELADFPMFRKLLLNLRRRAEALADDRRSREGPGNPRKDRA